MRKTFKHIKNIQRSVLILCVAVFIASCSATKFVPEDKYLLSNVKVKCDNRKIDLKELKTYLRQSHNTRILGFWKFHLGLYNLSSKKQKEGWLKRIGEAPVVFDEYLTGKSLEQINLYLRSKGYYNAQVLDTVKYRKDKVDLLFKVATGNPHRISNVSYEIRDSILNNVVLSDLRKSNVKLDSPFDLDVLEKERDRIVRRVRNSGFYSFSKNAIYYEADTLDGDYKVKLKMVVDNESNSLNEDSLVAHKKFFLNDFYVFSDFDPKEAVADPDKYFASLDTLKIDSYSFIHSGKQRIKPEVIKRVNHIDDSLYFRVDGVDRTYKSLNELKNYRYINVQFKDGGRRDSLSRWLDCYMQLTPSIPQSYSVELEGTNSSGDFGFATNFNYQHKNILGGAEIFNLRLKGAIERLRWNDENDKTNKFNSRELGADLKLTIPKFLAPEKIQRFFRYDVPSSSLNLSYNYQKRPEYTRTISSFRFGYFWKSSKYLKHSFTPFDLNMVRIFEKDEDFFAGINDMYIKASFTDHVVSSLNYNLTFNSQELEKRKDYSYVRWNTEVAGNLINGISKLTNQKQVTETDTEGNVSNYYKFLGSRYAQYFKTDVDLRYGWVLDKANTLVARFFAGAGIPYGNWDLMPFEKQYFGGGANGIRAWMVRTLGPGTYNAPEGAYPNQLGDIKLESNLEYRFKMFWLIEGALFLDAGNIWSISSKDNREGAVFKWGEFYNELAVGTGFGTRFDFKYAIFRLDLGLKLRDPSQIIGKRWIPSTRKFEKNDLVLSFAIGYPF